MKVIKWVVLFAVFVAMGAQAATFTWSADIALLDTGGPLDDGAVDGGWHYALPGVDLYLIYNGVGASYTPVNAVQWWSFPDQLYYQDDASLWHPLVTGTTAGTIVASYTTTEDDYATGNFSQEMSVPGLTWFGDTSATWEDMNLREFTILSISDTDDNYADGAFYNLYTDNPSGFSTATGNFGSGFMNANIFEVSAAGAIPEPSSALLVITGGALSVLYRRRSARGTHPETSFHKRKQIKPTGQ